MPRKTKLSQCVNKVMTKIINLLTPDRYKKFEWGKQTFKYKLSKKKKLSRCDDKVMYD